MKQACARFPTSWSQPSVSGTQYFCLLTQPLAMVTPALWSFRSKTYWSDALHLLCPVSPEYPDTQGSGIALSPLLLPRVVPSSFPVCWNRWTKANRELPTTLILIILVEITLINSKTWHYFQWISNYHCLTWKQNAQHWFRKEKREEERLSSFRGKHQLEKSLTRTTQGSSLLPLYSDSHSSVLPRILPLSSELQQGRGKGAGFGRGCFQGGRLSQGHLPLFIIYEIGTRKICPIYPTRLS